MNSILKTTMGRLREQERNCKLCNWCDAIKISRVAFKLTLCNRRAINNKKINSPASNIRPINSLRPILSKSNTMTSNEHSLIFSHGTLKLNESLKCGFKLHLKIGVFRFSMRLSPNCSQTFTYGSENGKCLLFINECSVTFGLWYSYLWTKDLSWSIFEKLKKFF